MTSAALDVAVMATATVRSRKRRSGPTTADVVTVKVIVVLSHVAVSIPAVTAVAPSGGNTVKIKK